MTERATMEELLEFANRVRAAGGGNPLDALMPAVPASSTECLIARNLNFNCSVDGLSALDKSRLGLGADEGSWVMFVDDVHVRDAIADGLGLLALDDDYASGKRGAHMVVLPPKIGQVAEDFDNALENGIYLDHFTGKMAATTDPGDRGALQEFWPYIEASARESYANADFVGEQGRLVL